MDHPIEKRRLLINELFPRGVPRLWCPLLTHYGPDGGIDFDRMAAHFEHIVPWIKGFLIPGSTGDGWELDDAETLQVAEFAVRQAEGHQISLLLGVLKGDTDHMIRTLEDLLKLVLQGETTAGGDRSRILRSRGVCGFTVCPPKGKDLTQDDIGAGLTRIFAMGLPTALYQLPQVTENEVAPGTFGRLVRQHFNLIFFKDSSGQDRIATADVERDHVFFVRGAEGDYAQWLKDAGGPYDGFLLSTANSFPRELQGLIEDLEQGDQERAREISGRLTMTVREVFALVQALPCGNAFTNANKAIDHFMAFGPSASAQEGPMLHAKVRIPSDIIVRTGAVLKGYNLMPEKGYLD